MDNPKIVIIGAGPGGMMAAIRASSLGAQVTLLEKKKSPGNKLLLSGKGRCNLTNTEDLPDFLKRFSKNGEFLRDAFKKFFNRELMDFFKQRRLDLTVERQKRVFPLTERSAGVLRVLENELGKNKVNVICGSKVTDVLVSAGRASGVLLEGGKIIAAPRVILATGGASYSFTGSDASGIDMAAKLGHKICPLKAGLVPLDIKENYAKKLEGLTLRNIRIKFCGLKRQIISEVGEMLFTSTGISGPLVISLSGQVADLLEKGKVIAELDLKPGLTVEQLDARLLREFKLNSKKNIKNTLKELLPLRLIEVFAQRAGMDMFKKCSQVTQAEREKIVTLLKNFSLEISGTRPLEEGMVTRGGVSLKEINPRTLESRLVKGLYFCGEMIDLDADTGGFNLQAAFSTGYLAGSSAANAGTVLNPKQNCPLKRDSFPLS